jgi:ABC-type glycerol-3-phosphate transport system substrate-binding protein
MFLLASCSGSAEIVDNTHSSANESNYIDISFIKDIERAQIAVGENGDIYLTDEIRIYILDSKGNKKKQIESEKGRHYKLLTTHDDGFFAYGHGSQLEEYNTDGALIKKHNLAVDAQSIEKMLYMDGKLFILYHIGDNENDKYLAEYNLEDGNFKKIDVELVKNFVEYKENTLLIFLKQDCCSGHMLTYNIKNGEKSEELHIPEFSGTRYSYYDSSKDRLYLISQGTIYIASVDEKKMIETYTSGILPKSYTACYRNNISYFIDKNQKIIVSLDLNSLNNSKNITILCHDYVPESYFSRVAYEFGVENNNTTVKFINISTEEYTTKLNSMLMSGDNSFDIYLLSTLTDIPSYYIKKGVYEDLHSYPVVSQKFDDMFEGIEKLCSYNGDLFGIPVGIHNSDTVYQLNIEMLKDLNLEMPAYDWVWSDFEKYAENIAAKGTYFMIQQGKYGTWNFNMFSVSNCIKLDMIKETFSYTKEDIKNELLFIDRIYEKGFILNEGRSFKKKENILLNCAYMPINDRSLDNSKIIPTPVFNDKRSYPFMVNYFCMNKASKNKQLTSEFLGKCISREVQAADLITQMPILYRDKSIYKESVYRNFITDEWNYNVYSYMLKNSYRNETYTIDKNIAEYIRNYFEGGISSDEAVEAVYNKMKQIVEE